MAEMKWTQEQADAITQKDCNLLVAAAAGSGKTAVLVERIIQKIIDDKSPIDIDSLLVVTFTNAAATEMRERIGAAISRAMEENKSSKNIHRQLALLNKAAITTIHSFCLDVIRNHFQSIDIDPDFRILDETEAALLRMEALNEQFEELYEEEEKHRDYFDLLECYGTNRDDQNIQDMVLNVYNFVQSHPQPEQWLKEKVESFNLPEGIDFMDTRWGKILLDNARIRLTGIAELLASVLEKLKYALGLEKYIPVFLDDYNNLQRLLAVCDASGTTWDGIFECLQTIAFATLPRASKEADKEFQEKAKAARDQLKTLMNGLKSEVFFMKSEEILQDLRTMYPILRCLADLVIEFSERYALKKSRRASVDFGDLEHFCLKILSQTDEEGKMFPTKVAQAYKEKFSEILVDEYQDSNLVQEIIIGMISREDRGTPNVFMVGDVKQSIYRFRQAKPELFLEKYNRYSGSDSESLFKKILLFKNFRSRKEIVDGVNFIFKQIMSMAVGELEYTKTEELNPGAGYLENTNADSVTGGEIELHLIETAADGSDGGEEIDSGENIEDGEMNESREDDEAEEILDNIQKEARMVARRIVGLMKPDQQGLKFQVFDKKINQYRDVQFKDIVILLRTTKNWTDIFSEELAGLSIPTFSDTGSGFFKTPEVQVILSLLQIIDNPYQDIPLLAVLRSQIGDFTTDDLAELRLADKKAALFAALRVLAEGSTGASKKAAAFLSRLQQWRDMSVYMSTHQLIWQLYNDTGYLSIVGAMQDGDRKQANLRVLFERALQFENTSYKGLFNFINFVDKLKSNKGDMGSAKILGENDDVVRLMSIHKSKGLEFPVVFLCGCGKKMNFQDMYKSVLLHQELGFGPEFVDCARRIKYPSMPKLAIAQKVKTETLSEEMRILYVALTRAKEKLILTGAVGNIQKAATKWLDTAHSGSEKFAGHEMLRAQNYLDWLGPSILRHADSTVLREAAGLGAEYTGAEITDDSRWKIYLYGNKDVAGHKNIEDETAPQFEPQQWLAEEEEEGAAEEKRAVRAAYYGEINRRLGWKYQYRGLNSIPSKISVTELKRYFKINNEGEDSLALIRPVIKKPAFLQEKKGLSSAEKGTVMHFVMQHINFYDGNIEKQIEEMVKADLITGQQAKSVNVNKIGTFLSSRLGQRLLAADNIYREVPFNIQLPFTELYPDCGDFCEANEKILLQGVIDCYFIEDNQIILIDYKTDYVSAENIEEIKDKYRLQISYYARALELLTRLPVTEKYIYLFSAGEIAEI